ncbi:hypothetical protein PFISCL1PPCAC_9873 [Pristionchus fissidentatus]|uniref:Uncharacterized protein n=1 Tax=Pristionchus fissidentatus TaxID=1538716 RepID=A0AAV5VIV4_9BILA|nr:hypothetical protein PFISCL1PPCAC_9873 [Pristionchus fissidentatus]
MNQAIQYSYGADPRGSGSGGQQSASALNFHQSFHPTSTYTAGTAPFSHGASSFIPGTSDYKMPGVATSQGQSMRLNPAVESDDRRIAALLDSYFIDTPSASWNQQQNSQSTTIGQQAQQRLQAGASSSSASYSTPGGGGGSLSVTTKGAAKMMTPEKRDKERLKRLKQAEAARLRYHRLSSDQKKDLNMKRTIAQKRKRQREKELEELESILRQSNDIQEDPEVTDQLRERRMRAKWAEAARARYQRMSSEERRAHNNKRRMRQMQNAITATKDGGLLASMDVSVRDVLQAEGLQTGDPGKDDEVIRMHMKEQNGKKAEAARARYHRMSEDEKRQYNQRRTEAFRRRRMEEEMLLAMPIGRINGEALDRAQQIVVRNAKRAEAARLRYQRMSPDQRKQYNQVRTKRYTPKRKRGEGSVSGDISGNSSMLGGFGGGGVGGLGGLNKKTGDDEVDALTTLERDVMKRTAQAQQTLARTSGGASRLSYSSPSVGASSSNGPTLATHLGTQLQSQQSLLHHVQPQQMASYSNQGLSGMGHLQPILNPYTGTR